MLSPRRLACLLLLVLGCDERRARQDPVEDSSRTPAVADANLPPPDACPGAFCVPEGPRRTPAAECPSMRWSAQGICLPEAPRWTEWPCFPPLVEGPPVERGLRGCVPSPALVTSCPDGQIHALDQEEPTCVPMGWPCVGEYPDDESIRSRAGGAEGAIFFVAPDADGVGTRADPMGMPEDGLLVAEPGDVIVLAAGRYDRDGLAPGERSFTLPPGAALLGACTDETHVSNLRIGPGTRVEGISAADLLIDASPDHAAVAALQVWSLSVVSGSATVRQSRMRGLYVPRGASLRLETSEVDDSSRVEGEADIIATTLDGPAWITDEGRLDRVVGSGVDCDRCALQISNSVLSWLTASDPMGDEGIQITRSRIDVIHSFSDYRPSIHAVQLKAGRILATGLYGREVHVHSAGRGGTAIDANVGALSDVLVQAGGVSLAGSNFGLEPFVVRRIELVHPERAGLFARLGFDGEDITIRGGTSAGFVPFGLRVAARRLWISGTAAEGVRGLRSDDGLPGFELVDVQIDDPGGAGMDLTANDGQVRRGAIVGAGAAGIDQSSGGRLTLEDVTIVDSAPGLSVQGSRLQGARVAIHGGGLHVGPDAKAFLSDLTIEGPTPAGVEVQADGFAILTCVESANSDRGVDWQGGGALVSGWVHDNMVDVVGDEEQVRAQIGPRCEPD